MLIINQAWGIGDIIFSMTAIRKQNQKILWPVLPEFVEGLNFAYPDIIFINWKHININYEKKGGYKLDENTETIPLRYTYLQNVSEVMSGKYKMFGYDWSIWKEQAEYKRNMQKEKELFNALGIHENESFNLINEHYTNSSKYIKRIKPPDNGYRNIYMKTIPGYSVFDWSLVIQKAKTIHTVATSIVFLIELLPIDAREIKIYRRDMIPKDNDHSNYKFILTSHNYLFE